MFLDNLSAAVLRLCEQEKLTYERAAERCGLSSRYFGKIVRRGAVPSVVTLEKLCVGLRATPNELLLRRELDCALPVVKVCCFSRETGYPVCPGCGIALEREYQRFCDRCGQKLCWREFEKAEVVLDGGA